MRVMEPSSDSALLLADNRSKIKRTQRETESRPSTTASQTVGWLCSPSSGGETDCVLHQWCSNEFKLNRVWCHTVAVYTARKANANYALNFFLWCTGLCQKKNVYWSFIFSSCCRNDWKRPFHRATHKTSLLWCYTWIWTIAHGLMFTKCAMWCYFISLCWFAREPCVFDLSKMCCMYTVCGYKRMNLLNILFCPIIAIVF